MDQCEIVLAFWFSDIDPAQWWRDNSAFDDLIRQHFCPLLTRASRAGLPHWRESPRGRLAEILVLDQFPRRVFRGTPEAFAYERLAMGCAQEAIDAGDDMRLPMAKRVFVYGALWHGENHRMHELALSKLRAPGLELAFKCAQRHKDIIDRFGRDPCRNAVLERINTPEEEEFLLQRRKRQSLAALGL